MTAAITDADRLAASRLLIGEKVGGGDGQTYVLKTPNYRDAEQAFAAHRLQARKEAIEEAIVYLANARAADMTAVWAGWSESSSDRALWLQSGVAV